MVVAAEATGGGSGDGGGDDSDAFKAKRGRRSRRSSVKRGSLNSSSGQGSRMAGGKVASIHLPAEVQMDLARCVKAWESTKTLKLAEEARLGREMSFAEWAVFSGLDEDALRRRCDDGLKARELLIMTNINLVKSMALKFTAMQERNENRLSMDDLTLEGTQGLLKAMTKFDPRRGIKFTTYAVWWIRQAMSLAISTHSSTVRLPILLQQRIKLVREARARLYLQLEREPLVEELAEAVGLPAAKVDQIRRTGRGRSLLSEEDQTLTDLAVGLHTLPDATALDPDRVSSTAPSASESAASASSASSVASAAVLAEPVAIVGAASAEAEEGLGGEKGGALSWKEKEERAKEELLGQLKRRGDRSVVEARWEEIQRRERTVMAVSGRRMKRIQDELTAFLRLKDFEDRQDFSSMLCVA